MVMDISLAEGSSDKIVTAMNRTDGLFHINAKTVILAMGCRERSRGALNIRATVLQASTLPEPRSAW